MVEIKKATMQLRELRGMEMSIAKIVTSNIKNEKVRYRLSKLAKVLTSELTDFEKERQRMIKENGQKDEKGNWKVKEEHEEEVNRQMEELLSEPVEVSFVPVDLTGIDVELTAIDMMNLEPFLDAVYVDKLMTDDETGEEPKKEVDK